MTQALDNPGGRWMFAIPGGIALILVLLVAMLIGVGQYGKARDAAMRSWPSTLGTVTGSGLQQQRQNDGYWNVYEVTGYQYVVAGRSYDFTQSLYVGRGQSQSSAGGAVSHHRGDSVRLFYDPKSPSDASLTNAPQSPSIVLTLIALLLAAFSLPLWYLSARWFWQSRRTTAGASA